MHITGLDKKSILEIDGAMIILQSKVVLRI